MIKSGSSRHSTIIHHLNLLLLLMLPWLFGILSHHHSKISSNHVAAVNAAGFMNHARHAQHHNLRKHEDYDVSQTRNKHHIPLFFASSSSAAATIYPEDHVDDNKASLIAWTTATTQRHSRPFSYLTRLLLAGRPRKPASSSDPEFDLVSNNNNKDDDDDDDDDDDEFDTDDQDVSSSSSSLYFVPEAQVAERANQLAALLSSPSTNGISNIALDQELSNSFLQYALSIILGRALPDARDGLKPVHRRILYSMHQLHLLPTTSHRKCARVVGEVLGKFHPHGDVAVYDALVRLAQTFSTHYPLIDGHGNFGSIDADPAAAMRYTECRLSSIAQQGLLDELEYDTVDFIPNFDGNEMEPTVLPAKLPILLLNGCAGIAVGMATNVPPHNLGELMRACIALVDGHMQNTTLSDEALLTLVPAPDFPTGASILGKDGARQLYTTGHGGIVMRAITVLEKTVGKQSSKTTTTSRSAIVVTELPYQVNKAALLEKIADLVNDKKLEGIADLRDESDRDGIRMVIELKRDAVPAVVLNNLYKKTSLQTVFSGNFLALMSSNNNSSGTASNVIGPQRFTLRQALETFLQFRFDTIRRKSKFQYTKVTSRAHLVNGLLTALESVDDIIQLIKTAPDVATAREQLGLQYQLSPEQAEAVLKLQLGQLTRLNKNKLQNERDDLTKSAQQLDQLLQVDDAVRNLMKDEFQEMIQKFGTERKTVINMGENGEVAEMDLIKNSRSVIVVTRGGSIKRMPLKTFESQGRGTRGKRGTATTEEVDSEVAHCFTCNDHDTLLMVTQRGIAYGLRAYQVPIGSRTAKGQPIASVLPIKTEDDITTILPISEFTENEYLVLATEQGWIKKTPLNAFGNLSSRGLTIATLEENDRLKWCEKCNDKNDILIGTCKGKAVRFAAAKLHPTGRTSRGVHAMKLGENDTIADVNVLRSSQLTEPQDTMSSSESQTESSSSESMEAEYLLAVTSHGFGKRVKTKEFRTQGRGGAGNIAIKFKKSKYSNDRMSCLRIVKEDDEILVITAKGIMVRQQVADIPSQGRSASGVMIQKVDVENGDHISSVSLLPKYEEAEDILE